MLIRTVSISRLTFNDCFELRDFSSDPMVSGEDPMMDVASLEGSQGFDAAEASPLLVSSPMPGRSSTRRPWLQGSLRAGMKRQAETIDAMHCVARSYEGWVQSQTRAGEA